MSARTVVRRVVVLAALGLVLCAGPAGADAAGPGDYRSEVTSVDPDPGGFSIETAGGDSFLVLSVDEGTEAVVQGYDGEPYLRFGADGTVEQNLNSPATYMNDERFGAGDLAPERLQGVDPTTLEPDWEEVATDGTYAWHDHRTHEMRPDAPVPRGESYEWSQPVVLEVDGETVEVTGEITFEEAVTPLPWYALAVVVAAVLGVIAVTRLTVALVAAAAVLAAAVAWIDYASQPAGTGASLVPVVIAAVALALAVLGLALVRLRTAGLLAGGVFLATWGMFRLAVLTNPVLPTDAPFVLERLAVALALGVGVGAVVVAFRSGALTTALLPAMDDGGP